MSTYLLTIQSTRREPSGVHVLPGIRISQSPDKVKSMKQGSRLELRGRDGRIIQSALMSYGVLVERNAAGETIFRGNLSDPEIVLTLPAETREDDILAGTEVWLI